MSMHEWVDYMWGARIPAQGFKILDFVRNHWEDISYETEEMPTTEEEAWDYAYDYDYGIAGIIAVAANHYWIDGAVDEYGNYFVGMWALTMFPWRNTPSSWKEVSQEEIISKIKPLMKELGVKCEFGHHDVWFWG